MSEEFKKQAAEKAIEEIESGMIVGLGSGSTVFYAIHKLAQEIRTGALLNIKGIASSRQTEKLANKLDIPLITFQDTQNIDVTIDGADEVDKYLNLIKGGGAAHLREKIREEMKQIIESAGITSIFVTHDKSDAIAISNKVMIIEKGEIIHFGTTQEMLTAM